MKFNLSIDEQDACFGSLNALDSQARPHQVNGQVFIERVPYILGASRRIVVKNILTLKASLSAFNEVKKSFLSEVWPNHPPRLDIQQLSPSMFPEGLFDKWKQLCNDAAKVKEEINLMVLPHTIQDGNEFPLGILSTLKEFGLLEDDPE